MKKIFKNKPQKLSDSTDTAIDYSTCCVSGVVSKDGITLIHGDSLQALRSYGDNHFDIALRTGKDVWFETNVVRNQKNVLKIQNAIHEVTGMKFNEYTTKSRKRDEFFARMLFVYHCRQHKMKLTSIAALIKRDHSSMVYVLNKYNDEVEYNSEFRKMAQKVDLILNGKNYM